MMQYSFTGYMVAAAIIMLISVLAYRVLMESKTSPSQNRMFLLSIYMLSFLLPILTHYWSFSTNSSQVEIGKTIAVGIGVATDIENFKEVNTIDIIMRWIMRIYYAGIIIFFLISITGFVRLFILMKNSEILKIEGFPVYIHRYQKLSAFSWFNKVFLFEDTLKDDQNNLSILLNHERAHLEKRHWIDLAIAQTVMVFQWFNPAAWYIRRELQRTHEYEADDIVLKSGIDEQTYQMLLIKNISGNRYSGLTDGLNNCSLKKRIIMMKKSNFKKDWLLRCMVIGGLAITGTLIFNIPAVASLLESIPEIQSENMMKITLKEGEKKDKNQVVVNKEGLQDVVIEIDGEEVTYEEMEKLNPEMIDNITVLKNPSKIIIRLKKAKDLQTENNIGVMDTIKVIGYGTLPKKEMKIKLEKDNEVSTYDITIKEVLPEASYEGGEAKLMKDLAYSVRFPEEAYKNGISGKVVVNFQVNPDGSISDLKVIKSVDPNLDAEALRALKALPGKWIPAKEGGKTITSVYSLTISFTLQ